MNLSPIMCVKSQVVQSSESVQNLMTGCGGASDTHLNSIVDRIASSTAEGRCCGKDGEYAVTVYELVNDDEVVRRCDKLGSDCDHN